MAREKHVDAKLVKGQNEGPNREQSEPVKALMAKKKEQEEPAKANEMPEEASDLITMMPIIEEKVDPNIFSCWLEARKARRNSRWRCTSCSIRNACWRVSCHVCMTQKLQGRNSKADNNDSLLTQTTKQELRMFIKQCSHNEQLELQGGQRVKAMVDPWEKPGYPWECSIQAITSKLDEASMMTRFQFDHIFFQIGQFAYILQHLTEQQDQTKCAIEAITAKLNVPVEAKDGPMETKCPEHEGERPVKVEVQTEKAMRGMTQSQQMKQTPLFEGGHSKTEKANRKEPEEAWSGEEEGESSSDSNASLDGCSRKEWWIRKMLEQELSSSSARMEANDKKINALEKSLGAISGDMARGTQAIMTRLDELPKEPKKEMAQRQQMEQKLSSKGDQVASKKEKGPDEVNARPAQARKNEDDQAGMSQGRTKVDAQPAKARLDLKKERPGEATSGEKTESEQLGRLRNEKPEEATAGEQRRVPMMCLSFDIITEAMEQGMEVQLRNLASRPEVVATGKNEKDLLAALVSCRGLVNVAKRALLGTTL